MTEKIIILVFSIVILGLLFAYCDELKRPDPCDVPTSIECIENGR